MPDGVSPKACTRCHQVQEIDAFYKKPGGPGGRDSWCKVCRKAYFKDRYAGLYRKRPPVPDGYKRCPRCKRTLAMAEFHANAGRKDGVQVYCKQCWVRYDKFHQKSVETRFGISERQLDRRRNSAIEREKHRARLYVHLAVRFGDLVRQPCRVCGAEKVEAHHTDYTKPLEVQWLCKAHHDVLHGDETGSLDTTHTLDVRDEPATR